MRPERWQQQVEHLYNAALERDPNQRAVFLAEACAGTRLTEQKTPSSLRLCGDFLLVAALPRCGYG